ncbi:hypothetical protein AVEN_129211-1 [Araneus ventricosus]|uniref:Uncharacterized protein n=1 Tax=Araneus ventricosus TaxID=182803 RepID=A0A4Y2ID15_ARAVE|nr:hypothetical protein AVEN_129211-1 [Araneus ventricosus]
MGDKPQYGCREICQATHRKNGASGRNSTDHSPQVRTSSDSRFAKPHAMETRLKAIEDKLVILKYCPMITNWGPSDQLYCEMGGSRYYSSPISSQTFYDPR